VARSCKHGEEPSGTIAFRREFFDQLSEYQLSKTDCSMGIVKEFLNITRLLPTASFPFHYS